MTKKMLLVIDMLNDFIVPEGKLSCGESAQRIVPFVVKTVKEFADSEFPIVFVKDAHKIDDIEFQRFPPHCVKETLGAELIEELLAYEALGKYYSVEKQRYSGFYNTNLDEILAKEQPDEIHVVGVCTNICVLYTVEELCNRDYKVIVYKDGVASFDEEAHKFALEQMEKVLGAEII